MIRVRRASSSWHEGTCHPFDDAPCTHWPAAIINQLFRWSVRSRVERRSIIAREPRVFGVGALDCLCVEHQHHKQPRSPAPIYAGGRGSSAPCTVDCNVTAPFGISEFSHAIHGRFLCRIPELCFAVLRSACTFFLKAFIGTATGSTAASRLCLRERVMTNVDGPPRCFLWPYQ